jgi:hypothetical protein
VVATIRVLCLKATIPSGSNKANGIIPQKFVIIIDITPSTNDKIPTILVLVSLRYLEVQNQLFF